MTELSLIKTQPKENYHMSRALWPEPVQEENQLVDHYSVIVFA